MAEQWREYVLLLVCFCLRDISNNFHVRVRYQDFLELKNLEDEDDLLAYIKVPVPEQRTSSGQGAHQSESGPHNNLELQNTGLTMMGVMSGSYLFIPPPPPLHPPTALPLSSSKLQGTTLTVIFIYIRWSRNGFS